jgi:hypothetical protein
MNELWQEAILVAVRNTGKRLALFLPNLLAMMTLVVLGLVAGWIVKSLLHRILLALKFDPLCERWGVSQAMAKAGVRRSCSSMVGRLSFWAVFLVFTFMGIDALNLPTATRLTTGALNLLPQLLTALLLLWAGWLLAIFLAQGALIAAVNAQLGGAPLIATLIRWGVLIFTAATVLTQLGIAKEVVVAAFSITFGGVILALALAFGLGGRDLARELLERRLRSEKDEEEQDEISHL